MQSKKKIAGLAGLLLGILLAGTGASAQMTAEISPASPKGRETVILKLSQPSTRGFKRDAVLMSGNKITVYLQPNDTNTGYAAGFTEVVLGQLPVGSYEVEVKQMPTDVYQTTGGSPLTSTQFTVRDENIGRAAFAPRFNWSDLWWSAYENGWGINIMTKNDQFFATWFVYDAEGRALWYTLQSGEWISNSCYRSPILETHGNPNGGLVAIGSVGIRLAGNGMICFSGYDAATFTYNVNGVSNARTLTRQPF